MILMILCVEKITKRLSKYICTYFKYIAAFCFYIIQKTKCGCTKEVNMHIAGLAKKIVFKMMVFEISNIMTHVVFSGKKFFFPDRLIIADDFAMTNYISR